MTDNRRPSTPHVLIVDPDDTYQEIMRDLLSPRMNVHFATNGQEALDICWDTDIDLMITEIELPDESTHSLIEKVKRKMPNTLVVVITNQATVENAISALRFGAIDFLKKPFSLEDIALLVEKFYSLTVNKITDYHLIDTIVEEKRIFELPTDFQIINPFLNELIEMVKRFVNIEKKTLLSLRLSIYEMLINAMEHGNLEISYEEKKSLLEKTADYQRYLHDRSKSEPYSARKVWLTYQVHKDELQFNIEDEGKGFNVKNIPSPVEENTVAMLNGRGIFITRVNMDNLYYNEKGNKVTMVKNLKAFEEN